MLMVSVPIRTLNSVISAIARMLASTSPTMRKAHMSTMRLAEMH